MPWMTLFNIAYILIILCSLLLLILDMRKLTTTQKEKIIQWLLYAVAEAEKQFGEKTGKIKLRYVYSLFIKTFPNFVGRLSFKDFSELVDKSLENLNNLLENNIAISNYIKGGK